MFDSETDGHSIVRLPKGTPPAYWDEVPEGDQDSTIWPDDDLWFELRGDR